MLYYATSIMVTPSNRYVLYCTRYGLRLHLANTNDYQLVRKKSSPSTASRLLHAQRIETPRVK